MKRFAIMTIIMLVLCLFAVPCAAEPIHDPQSISPQDALDLRIKNEYTKNYCDHGAIKNAAGYEYDSDKQLWYIKHSAQGGVWINHRMLNDTKQYQLLEYMYYVDICAETSLREVGALVLASTGVLAIATANPIGAIGGAIMLIAATIDCQIINGDKDKCLEIAYELVSQILR